MDTTNLELQLDELNVPLDQQETEDDVHPQSDKVNEAVLYNTDWTVETLNRQIQKGNINLDPHFQRREAWSLERKSKFIESILCSLPIPNVVLAEEQGKKGHYIVIDGKQRLFSISSFLDNHFPLKSLNIRADLNGKNFAQLSTDNPNDVSALENYPIRTVIIRNWPDEDYLYTVFYRLNSGSLPLSPQELRRALHAGKVLDYLDDYTAGSDQFKLVFGDQIDPRMRDIELVLRFVAFDNFYEEYRGNLKDFLDLTVRDFDADWDSTKPSLDACLERLDLALSTTADIFGKDAFKKWNGEKYERRINRAIFDVMTRFFSDKKIAERSLERRQDIVEAFQSLCTNNENFRNAVERSTKTPAATRTRLLLWGQELASIVGGTIQTEQMRII